MTVSMGMVGAQTANVIPGSHPAGIARSSRQRSILVHQSNSRNC
jgi:hypothetical protein